MTPKARARAEEMFRLYIDERLTLEEVGRRFGGVSKQAVDQLFRKAGLRARTRDDAQDLRAANLEASSQILGSGIAHKEIVHADRGPSQRDRGWRGRDGEHQQASRAGKTKW